MTVQFTELGYLPDSLQAFENLRALGDGFLLDSGCGYGDHIDVYSAAPALKTSIHAGNQSAKQLAQATHTLREQIEKHQTAIQPPNPDYPLPGWYGLLAYDLGSVTEKVANPSEHTPLPLANMGFYPSIVVTDHNAKSSFLIGLTSHPEHSNLIAQQLNKRPKHTEAFSLTTPMQSCWSKHAYTERFQDIQRYIHAGDCYQVNLAHRFSAEFEGSPWEAYRRLRDSISAPMASFFECDDWAMLSLSPERFIRCQNGELETKPIKGTRPVSADETDNLQQIRLLANSEKDRAENLMIVDLLRNDLGRSCVPGSIKVPSLFNIESFSNVHHMVSTITGKLRDHINPLDALLAAFPGGSITGAPKHRAMQIISELEAFNRGWYCGSAFYWDVSGKMDSSILIRSLTAHQNHIECWAGGGIVADSTADQEYQETLDKIGHIIKALS